MVGETRLPRGGSSMCGRHSVGMAWHGMAWRLKKVPNSVPGCTGPGAMYVTAQRCMHRDTCPAGASEGCEGVARVGGGHGEHGRAWAAHGDWGYFAGVEVPVPMYPVDLLCGHRSSGCASCVESFCRNPPHNFFLLISLHVTGYWRSDDGIGA